MTGAGRAGRSSEGRAGARVPIALVAPVVLGSVLDGIPAVVPVGPPPVPIVTQFGIHEVHDGMVVILAMGLGLFAPPSGLCYDAACIVGRVSREAGMRRIRVRLGWPPAGLVSITFVPWISTCEPGDARRRRGAIMS